MAGSLVMSLVVTMCLLHGRRVSGHPGHTGPVTVVRYSWVRTLDGGTNVTQTAVSIANGPWVLINSLDRLMFRAGMTASRTLLDFSVEPPVSVVRMGGVCFVMPSMGPSMSFNSVVETLQNRDGSTVSTPLVTVPQNATIASNTRLSLAGKRALLLSNPAVSNICSYRTPIYRSADADASSFPAAGSEARCERVMSTVTLDDLLRVLTNRSGIGCPFSIYLG